MNKSLKSKPKYECLKIIIPLILIAVIPVMFTVVAGSNIESQEPKKDVSINFITADTIKNNPELAIASGIRGLVEIGYADSVESGPTFAASKGEHVTIPIFISLTSYDPNLKSLDVLIDTSGNIGAQIWQYWYEYNSEGKETNRGVVRINDLITYDKEGIVTIETGDRVECTMFLDIPSDLPPLETKSIIVEAAGIGLKNEERGIFFKDNLGGKEVTLDE